MNPPNPGEWYYNPNYILKFFENPPSARESGDGWINFVQEIDLDRDEAICKVWNFRDGSIKLSSEVIDNLPFRLFKKMRPATEKEILACLAVM